jgi:CRISPR-associated protein Cas6
MLWQEERNDDEFVVPERTLDLVFQIRCPTLPVDHAWALSEAIRAVLPWFADDPGAGLHLIHGAESGNGWERPTEGAALIYLSRRSALTLRLPRERIEAAEGLSGATLEVHGHRMEIGPAKRRPLERTNTLYARYVASPVDDEDEQAFLHWAIDELKGLRLGFKKVLCGRQLRLRTPEGAILTRSLMVADLPYPDAVRLQEQGIGPHRSRGCGLFIPHKPV